MLAIFDEDVILENYEGLPEVLLIDGLESYCAEGQEYISELTKADPVEAHRYAHSLKTMSRMVGAMQMGDMCEDYEKNGEGSQYTRQEIVSHFNEVKIQIETYVASLKYG
jgi:HPt (histidine-containing phosphotransfer) domain-containing protein